MFDSLCEEAAWHLYRVDRCHDWDQGLCPGNTARGEEFCEVGQNSNLHKNSNFGSINRYYPELDTSLLCFDDLDAKKSRERKRSDRQKTNPQVKTQVCILLSFKLIISLVWVCSAGRGWARGGGCSGAAQADLQPLRQDILPPGDMWHLWHVKFMTCDILPPGDPGPAHGHPQLHPELGGGARRRHPGPRARHHLRVGGGCYHKPETSRDMWHLWYVPFVTCAIYDMRHLWHVILCNLQVRPQPGYP